MTGTAPRARDRAQRACAGPDATVVLPAELAAQIGLQAAATAVYLEGFVDRWGDILRRHETEPWHRDAVRFAARLAGVGEHLADVAMHALLEAGAILPAPKLATLAELGSIDPDEAP